MAKRNLRDKLDGNELDLSLDNLSEVPIKDIAALPKATSIDLSRNMLVTIHEDFCNLTQIVRLDLSKNKLKSLPEKLGNLHKLQYLDLLGNDLNDLPVSIFKLKNLKWLDLKDNPLDEQLAYIAGDCLDEAQCKKCAANIVQFYREKQADMERKKQSDLQKKRAQAEMKRTEDEAVRQRLKAEKMAEKAIEKERRRQEYLRKQAELSCSSQDDEGTLADDSSSKNQIIHEESNSWSVLSVVFLFMAFVMFCLFCGYYYCSCAKFKDPMCRTYGQAIEDAFRRVLVWVKG